jgi:N-acetylglucosamine kinase-like BadF-type ATPase
MGHPTILVKVICEYFGKASFQSVREAVYTSAVRRRDIAGLAVVVAEAARGGDTGAISVLERAGRELAEIALGVMRQLGMLETGMDVFTSGGVFRAGNLVLAPFRDALMTGSARSGVHEASYSPVVGALFMALRTTGGSLTKGQIESIRFSLPPVAIEKHRTG